MRCGRPGGWARRGAAGWGRRPSAPKLGAEPQAEQQRSAKQTPAQGAAAPPGRPVPRHGPGRPGGLRSASRAPRAAPGRQQGCGPELPSCQLWELPRGPGRGLRPASLPPIQGNLGVTLSCPAERAQPLEGARGGGPGGVLGVQAAWPCKNPTPASPRGSLRRLHSPRPPEPGGAERYMARKSTFLTGGTPGRNFIF